MNKLPPKTHDQILDDLQRFMRRHGQPLAAWYVGTAVSARMEMWDVHGFQARDVGVYRRAATAEDASSVASILMGCGVAGTAAVKPGASDIYLVMKT